MKEGMDAERMASIWLDILASERQNRLAYPTREAESHPSAHQRVTNVHYSHAPPQIAYYNGKEPRILCDWWRDPCSAVKLLREQFIAICVIQSEYDYDSIAG